MRTLVFAVVVLIGCGSRRDDASPRPPPPQPPVVAVVDAGVDPWAAAGPGSGSAAVAEVEIPSAEVAREIADTACPTVTGAYFFRVEKAGKTSHILGTRHLGVDIAKFPALVTDTLIAAKVAVFETAPDDNSDDGVVKPAHGRLPDELGPELWERYEVLVGHELATALADQEPATGMLMMIALYEDKSSALDDQLQQLAIAKQIPVRGLETSEFQERLIARWLDVRALRASVKVTDDRRELKQTTIDDLTEYCAGTDDDPGPDPKERQDMIDGGYTDEEIKQFEEELVFSRNRDWIPKLEKLFARGDAFIAVGADHLTGELGVPALLAKRGYQVTRVTPPRNPPP